MTYSMNNAFQKACTGLSMMIQWSPSAIGAYGVASVVKAKYIDSPEASKELELMASELEPEKVSFIRQVLRDRGNRKFNNPDHYNKVGISLAGIFSGLYFRQDRGKHGHIVFNPWLDASCFEDKDEGRASINHEAGHFDNNDCIKSALLYAVLPFAVEFTTRKIKAPLQAFTGAKNLISAGSPVLKSASQIPNAIAKTAAVSMIYNAYARSIEVNADNEVPNDIESLTARKNEFESRRKIILDRLAENKYSIADKTETSSLWNVVLGDHPTLTARIDAVDAKINALSKQDQ